MAIYYNNQLKDFYYGGNYFSASSEQGLMYYETVEVNPGIPNYFISASGGTITTDGDYKIHTFNSSSTFKCYFSCYFTSK